MGVLGKHMDLRKLEKNALKAYQPYYEESSYCIWIYVVVSFVLVAVFLAFGHYAHDSKIMVIGACIIGIYAICEFFANHRLAVAALIESKKKNWKKQKLTIRKIKTEASWSGHLWESVIPKLYPKGQSVSRYKIICMDENGQKVVLRIVMGGKKYQIIQDRVFQSLDTRCTIYYGAKSKIIIFFESNDVWTDRINHMF